VICIHEAQALAAPCWCHDLLNALGAVAVGLEAGAVHRIAAALEVPGRRSSDAGRTRRDGHQTTTTIIRQSAAVIAAARAGIVRRVVVVFLPHRDHRTNRLLSGSAPRSHAAKSC
jgi:UDP-N-acetylmuramate-alanine ligase